MRGGVVYILVCMLFRSSLADSNRVLRDALRLPNTSFTPIEFVTFEFVVRDRRAYVKLHVPREPEDRGVFTRLGLYLAMLTYDGPPAFAGFYLDDHPHPWGGPPVLAFSQKVNTTSPLLIPDHDVWGWTTHWVPPIEVFSAEAEAAPPWHLRAPTVHWRGSIRGTARRRFSNCARSHADFDVAPVHWEARAAAPGAPACMRSNRELALITCRRDKPAEMDDRRLLRHRYLVYQEGFGWSSIIKRLLVSGAAVLVPRKQEYVSLATEWAENQPAVLKFETSDPCASIRAVVDQADATALDAAALETATRARAFFSRRTSERYLRLLMRALGSRQHNIPQHDELLAMGYEELTCAFVQRDAQERLEPHQEWQLSTWYDNVTCLPKAVAVKPDRPL